jgi:hypothetical protein
MRFFLNLARPTDGFEYPEVGPEADFEVRVKVVKVSNISVYKDSERNDVYVQGYFQTKDRRGRAIRKKQETDVHPWAYTEASFNHLMVFPVKCPVRSCQITFSLMDRDRVTANDEIYEPKVFSLDHMLMLAYRNFRDGKDTLGTLKQEIMFDRWKGMHDRPRLWKRCLGHCGLMQKPRKIDEMFANLSIEVQILPKEEADIEPQESGVYAEPQGRVTPMYMATNPGIAARVVLGPTCFRRCGCIAIILGILITVFVILILFYYLTQTGFMPPVHDW